MSDSFAPTPERQLSEAEAQQFLLQLRRKQGNWVEWGHACLILQQAGFSAQTLFEETGFEPTHQNQVIGATQVYESLKRAEAPAELLDPYAQKGSDVLYELRPLDQKQRLQAARFALERQLDQDEAHDLVKAMKDYSRLKELPEGFGDCAGDAVAYQCWRLARERSELQERSRLIARGLGFAETESARRRLEKLLTDFSIVKSQMMPMQPVYRLEQEEELPRLVPIAGSLPLSVEQLQAIPAIQQESNFRYFSSHQGGAWIPLPGWQAVLKAVDPVALFCRSNQLPMPLDGDIETILVLGDRANKVWQVNNFYLYEEAGKVALGWFSEAPSQLLLGQLVLIMRPKKILDESIITSPWQLEE
jgi:hypothetical protein